MNVLVYQPGSLGDSIITIPAFRAIRRHFGDLAHITVLFNQPTDSRATSRDVLEATGLVDSFLPYKEEARRRGFRGNLSKLTLYGQLLVRRFSAVVYLAPSNRTLSSIDRDKAFFAAAGMRQSYGFSVAKTVTSPGLSELPHEIDMMVTRLVQDGIASAESDFRIPYFSLPDADTQNARSWLAKHGYDTSTRLIAICPGGNQPSNFWPVERFIAIGKKLLELDNIRLVVIGGEREAKIGAEMVQVWNSGYNACGQFSVVGSGALLKQCALHIGLDTGTTHLASILGVPSVALYSGRNPKGQWVPLGEKYEIVRHDVPCSGCRLVACDKPDHPCMTSITVDEVWDKIAAFLELLLPVSEANQKCSVSS